MAVICFFPTPDDLLIFQQGISENILSIAWIKFESREYFENKTALIYLTDATCKRRKAV